MYKHLCFLVSVLISMPPAAGADNKPYAPVSIEGVRIVTAEEAIDLILKHPDMTIIDSRKKA